MVIGNLIRTKKRAVILALFILIVIPVVLYLYSRVQNSSNVLGSKSEQAVETQDMVERVGKLVELPTETPTVAAVTDASKLASQPFFSKAQNGDVVLIFQKAQRAILYRPSTNKVIEFAPIDTGSQDPSAAPTVVVLSPTPTNPPFRLQLPSKTPTSSPESSPQ